MVRAPHWNNETFEATIREIKYRYILVSFEKDGCIQNGYISMNNLGFDSVEEGQLDSLLSVGDSVNVIITGYNQNYSNWYMRVVN